MKHLSKISLAAMTLLPASAFAAAEIPGITPVTPSNDMSIANLLSTIITWILGLSGAIAVLFLILGGLQYITSSGNKDKAEQAKQTILYAVIGLIVIALSFVIVAFVSQNVGKVVTPQ
jgi:cytochrome bd-type quinol oxidase subunit 2